MARFFRSVFVRGGSCTVWACPRPLHYLCAVLGAFVLIHPLLRVKTKTRHPPNPPSPGGLAGHARYKRGRQGGRDLDMPKPYKIP